MRKICEEQLCSGCGVCTNICPRNCITLKENSLGIKVPVINLDECINCDMCKKVCPQNNIVNKSKPLKCYASYTKEYKNRLDSASGGVGFEFYKAFLSAFDNSEVVGVSLSNNQEAIYEIEDDTEHLHKFQGSKYVQADTGYIYRKIADSLSADKYVLMVGTPCQIAACLSYLRLKKVKEEKLVTIDLLCHGVSPQQYLNEEMAYLNKKYKWRKINRLSFRSNRKYRNFHMHIEAEKKNGKIAIYNRYSCEDLYFYGFLEGVTLRESCYNCKFSTNDRVGDLTIGDFIGLGLDKDFEGNKENTSLILCNTEKGSEVMNQISMNLNLYEREFDEATHYGTSMLGPTKKSEFRNKFVDEYKDKDFVEAMKCALGKQAKLNKKENNLVRILKLHLIKKLDKKKK